MDSSKLEQPQILNDLKLKYEQLKQSYQTKKIQIKKYHKTQEQLNFQNQNLRQQTSIQSKKFKSLSLLVYELQRSLQDKILQQKKIMFNLQENADKKLTTQNSIIRHQLIKMTERSKNDQKILSFIKQIRLNQPKTKEYIQRSNYIQNQSQLLAKLRSQIKNFQNQNFQCRRKWSEIQTQKINLQGQLKIYKLQIERQASFLKENYEEYLEKINLSKNRIVHFNQTQKQKILTDFLIEEVALIQQKRVQIEQQNRNLHFHQQSLKNQLQRISLQNRELNSFFVNQTMSEQSKLSLKMKARIQQLRDTFLQQSKKYQSQRLKSINSNIQFVKRRYTKIKEGVDLLEIKLKNDLDGKSSYNQKEISQFFTQVLNVKDQKIMVSKERSKGLKDQLRNLKNRQELLRISVQQLQQSLKGYEVEQTYKEQSLAKRLKYSNNSKYD